jgi:hypothetical protein
LVVGVGVRVVADCVEVDLKTFTVVVHRRPVRDKLQNAKERGGIRNGQERMSERVSE